MIERMSQWTIISVYAVAYCNLLAYWGYYLLYLLGFAGTAIGFNGKPVGLFILCIVGGALPAFGLYSRYEFDLLTMQHGTSAPSRFIWTGLSLSLVLVMQYAYWTEVIH